MIDDAIATIELATTELIADGGRLVCLGGDHTIAFPLLRSVHRRHGPVALVHFDAHVDTYDTYMGAAFTHGTPFRRAAEGGLFSRDHSMHVGIRGSKYGPEDLEDDAGFEQLQTAAQVEAFFDRYFPDAVPLLPGLAEGFARNPTGSLVTVRCAPWHAAGRVVLLGDAAHAVVPFYGQGANASFEDCLVLRDCLAAGTGGAALARPRSEAQRGSRGIDQS